MLADGLRGLITLEHNSKKKLLKLALSFPISSGTLMAMKAKSTFKFLALSTAFCFPPRHQGSIGFKGMGHWPKGSIASIKPERTQEARTYFVAGCLKQNSIKQGERGSPGAASWCQPQMALTKSLSLSKPVSPSELLKKKKSTFAMEQLFESAKARRYKSTQHLSGSWQMCHLPLDLTAMVN